MIQPQDYIAVRVKVWARDRDWLVGLVGEDRQGAGGIKPNAPNCVWVDIVLADGALHRNTNTTPYIRR